jgi:hypothetical protein
MRKLRTAAQLFVKKLHQMPALTYIWFLERRIPRSSHSLFQKSLIRFSRNKYSQVGQDGIIEEIFNRLQISNGTFCEFGAWDGMHLSNARKLVDEGWDGIFIEGNIDRYNQLVENYPSNKIIKINAWVGYRDMTKNTGSNLSDLLCGFVSEEYISNLDLLIVDVDGLDLEIATSSMVQAKVLVIEGGSSFAPNINEPFPYAGQNYQHPLQYIINQLGRIGYTPVCFRQDLFLVRDDLVERVNIENLYPSSEDLFADNFYTLSRFERRWQMNRRFNSREIREFEIRELGSFHPNPLQGLSKTKLSKE